MGIEFKSLDDCYVHNLLIVLCKLNMVDSSVIDNSSFIISIGVTLE